MTAVEFLYRAVPVWSGPALTGFSYDHLVEIYQQVVVIVAKVNTKLLVKEYYTVYTVDMDLA